MKTTNTVNRQLRKSLARISLIALGCLGVSLRSFAQYDADWTGGTGDFFDPGNWDTFVPTNGYSFSIDNGGTAIIDTNSPLYSGPVYYNYFNLGDAGTGSGNLQINSGEIHASEAWGSSFSAIGQNNVGASLVMNGGSYYYDGPQNDVAAGITGNTYLTNGNNYLWNTGIGGARAGVNGLQFQVGVQKTGTTNCVVALHSNAVLCVANSVDFGDASGGTAATFQNTTLIMDGNAQFNVGDGVGFGRDYATFTGVMSGNSSWTVGNSMGVGNTNGCSNQGYFAYASRDDHYCSLTLKDHASVHTVLLKNAGYGSILLTNNAFFGIYDVLSPNSYHNPLAYTNTLYYPYADSFWGYQNVDDNKGLGYLAAWGIPTFTVADHAMFVVNTFGISVQLTGVANWPDTATNAAGVAYTNLIGGLSIGNGGYTKASNIGGGGANGFGGRLIVKDYGTFLDFQSLHLATSQSVNTMGLFRVQGPNATIAISNELRLAINLINGVCVPLAAIEEVITAPTQSTINVGNRAWLTNGALVVMTGDTNYNAYYTPHGGETYNLVAAGMVDGLPKVVDYSYAPLAPGLVWNLTASSKNLVLQVVNTFKIQKSGNNTMVSWQNQPGTTNVMFGGNIASLTNILQSSKSLTTGWTDVPGAASPYLVNPTTNAALFFRLRH